MNKLIAFEFFDTYTHKFYLLIIMSVKWFKLDQLLNNTFIKLLVSVFTTKYKYSLISYLFVLVVLGI